MKVYAVRMLSEPEKLERTCRGENSTGPSFLTSGVKLAPFTQSQKLFRVMDHLPDEQYRGLIWIIQI